MEYNNTYLNKKEVSYIEIDLNENEKLQIDNFFTNFLEYVNKEGRIVDYETAELPGGLVFRNDCNEKDMIMVAFGPKT